MRTQLLPEHFRNLFANAKELRFFLQRIKKLPQPKNVQADKDPKNFGLYFKSGSWNLIYYAEDYGNALATRMWSLRTEDVVLAREIRDAIRDVLNFAAEPPRFSGLRGARWILEHPNSMEGIRVVVTVKAPGKNKKFETTGSSESLKKAMEWRLEAAEKYLRDAGAKG